MVDLTTVLMGAERMRHSSSREMAVATKRILLVDSDESARKVLVDDLETHHGFEIIDVESGANALAALEKKIFDAILLCVELADTDGREVCRRIRRNGIHIPIIMLSVKQGEADLILSIEVGADDHVTKPIRTPVLLARLRALLRQCEWSERVTYLVGPYVLRPGEKVLHHTADDRDITLTDKEYTLLKLLHQAGDAGIDNNKLYRKIWGHTTPLATHTLQTHVYRLRRKMESDPSNPEIILSGPGGYRLARQPR